MRGRQKESWLIYKEALMTARQEEIAKNELEVKRLNAYEFDYNNDEQRTLHIESLMQKNNAGKTLTPKEVNYLCGCIKHDCRHEFNICDDYRFYDLYLDHFGVKNNLQLSPKYYPSYFLEKENHRMYSQEGINSRNLALNGFHDVWKTKINDDNQSNDKAYMEVRKEARTAIKQIKRNPNLSASEKIDAEKETILRSKVIYQKTKKALQNLNQDVYNLQLCGEEVHIDTFTLTHVMFRHYAEMTKPFADGKTYFTPELPIELILPKLHSILAEIENSGRLGSQLPQFIFFEHLGRLYRVYFKEVTKSEAGRGMYKVQRVNTFYPVETQKDLKEAKKLTAHKIAPFLKVYI